MKPLEFKITEDPGVGGRLRLWMGPLCMTPVMRSDSREEIAAKRLSQEVFDFGGSA